MTSGPRYRVPFRRRRSGRTDYRARLGLLRSGRPRAVVRLSGGRVLVAVTEYDPTGDRIVASAESSDLKRAGYPDHGLLSTPAAYLVGYLAGLRAKEAGRTEAVLDLGLRRPAQGGRLLSALKGLLDAGVEVPHGETVFPSADRLNGTHLRPPLDKPLEAYKGELSKIIHRPKESP